MSSEPPGTGTGPSRDWGSGKRREAGKEQRVEVPHNEGVANHIGPESCVECPRGTGEALTGVRVGQPLSGERSSGVPMLSDRQKATRRGAIMRVPRRKGVRMIYWSMLLAAGLILPNE